MQQMNPGQPARPMAGPTTGPGLTMHDLAQLLRVANQVQVACINERTGLFFDLWRSALAEGKPSMHTTLMRKPATRALLMGAQCLCLSYYLSRPPAQLEMLFNDVKQKAESCGVSMHGCMALLNYVHKSMTQAADKLVLQLRPGNAVGMDQPATSSFAAAQYQQPPPMLAPPPPPLTSDGGACSLDDGDYDAPAGGGKGKGNARSVRAARRQNAPPAPLIPPPPIPPPPPPGSIIPPQIIPPPPPPSQSQARGSPSRKQPAGAKRSAAAAGALGLAAPDSGGDEQPHAKRLHGYSGGGAMDNSNQPMGPGMDYHAQPGLLQLAPPPPGAGGMSSGLISLAPGAPAATNVPPLQLSHLGSQDAGLNHHNHLQPGAMIPQHALASSGGAAGPSRAALIPAPTLDAPPMLPLDSSASWMDSLLPMGSLGAPIKPEPGTLPAWAAGGQNNTTLNNIKPEPSTLPSWAPGATSPRQQGGLSALDSAPSVPLLQPLGVLPGGALADDVQLLPGGGSWGLDDPADMGMASLLLPPQPGGGGGVGGGGGSPVQDMMGAQDTDDFFTSGPEPCMDLPVAAEALQPLDANGNDPQAQQQGPALAPAGEGEEAPVGAAAAAAGDDSGGGRGGGGGGGGDGGQQVEGDAQVAVVTGAAAGQGGARGGQGQEAEQQQQQNNTLELAADATALKPKQGLPPPPSSCPAASHEQDANTTTTTTATTIPTESSAQGAPDQPSGAMGSTAGKAQMVISTSCDNGGLGSGASSTEVSAPLSAQTVTAVGGGCGQVPAAGHQLSPVGMAEADLSS